jgi:hypothetical protein
MNRRYSQIFGRDELFKSCDSWLLVMERPTMFPWSGTVHSEYSLELVKISQGQNPQLFGCSPACANFRHEARVVCLHEPVLVRLLADHQLAV